MSIFDQYKADGGFKYGPDDVFHEEEIDVVLGGMLGFCGCGMPDEAAAFLFKLLSMLDQRSAIDYKERFNIRDGLFSGEHKNGTAYLLYYFLDKEEITEHGGSVPGWLTEKGQMILDHLKEIVD